MKKFIVDVREVHVQSVEVEAADSQDALERVKEGEGTYLDGALEYSHTLDSDTWKAREHLPEEGEGE